MIHRITHFRKNTLRKKGFLTPIMYTLSMVRISNKRPYFVGDLSTDPVRRLKNVEAPQILGQLDKFFSSVFDHRQIKFILDMPARNTKSPDIT
jgi:hypothetical protein